MYSNGFAVKNVLCFTLWTFSVFMVTALEHFKVVGPAASLLVEAGSDLVLPCSLQPNLSAVDMMVEWFRPDLTESGNIIHLYNFYEDINDKQIESYRGRTALFKEELHKGNASLKLSAVQPSDVGEYKCLVKKATSYDDITLFVIVKGKSLHTVKIAVICISVFGVILIGCIAYILKDKFSKRQLSPVQCSAVSYMHLMTNNVRNEWNLKKYNTSEQGYTKLIPAISNCRKALLDGCNLTEQSTEALATALQSEKSYLKHLDLSNNEVQDSGVEKLSIGLKSPYCRVKVLRLVLCKLGQQSCTSLQSVLLSESCPLRELDLSNNKLEDSGVKQLSTGLKSLHCKLKVLRLYNCSLGERSCEYLESVLQSANCPLRELDLSNNNLQDSGVKLLSDGLKSSHCQLEILRLAGCKLKAEAWHFLTSALKMENNRLKELDFSNNDLQGVDTLFVGLKYLHLQILRLTICNLGEKSCKNLGSVLQSANCPLRELDLSNNDLLDSGVKQLSDGLKSSHCQLEILRLSGCWVTDQGCSSLASALSLNPSHLKELDLTYNHLGDSGVNLLSALLVDSHSELQTLRLDYAGSNRLKSRLSKYACELTLDPNTAHTELSLAEGNRKVTYAWENLLYPDHPERFDRWWQVMCREGLTGRCYWETEWSGEASFAVAYKMIERKGHNCKFGRTRNSWSVDYSNYRYIAKYSNNVTVIPTPASISNRMGVYLDWPAGILSFYNASPDTHTLTHLHTFQTTFTQPLYAGFGLSSDSSVSLCQIE